MRGRKPKPTALLKLEKGKLYDKQAARSESEPLPVEEILPRCPKGFSKEQKKLWRYFSQILKSYGLFNVANAAILEMLAMDWVLYKTCHQGIGDLGGPVVLADPITGEVLRPPTEPVLDIGIGPKPVVGVPRINPFFKPAMKLEERIMKSLGELGLSSLGLARIGSLLSNKGKAKSKMEGLLD